MSNFVRGCVGVAVQVKKYEMTDEDYDKYPKSLRAYVRERRKVDPNFKLFPKGDATAPKQDVESPECISHITLGSRCEIQPGGRRGSVEFVGQIPALAAGYWVCCSVLLSRRVLALCVALFDCLINVP